MHVRPGALSAKKCCMVTRTPISVLFRTLLCMVQKEKGKKMYRQRNVKKEEQKHKEIKAAETSEIS